MSTVSDTVPLSPGPRAGFAEAALQQLPSAIREINRVYLQHIQQRSLITVPDMRPWVGQPVTVFLRHDQVQVFAVLHQAVVGMANYVQLRAVRFHVDAVARKASNAELGPLPNRRTVHAYLTGELVAVAEDGRQPSAEQWEPIVYHPVYQSTFVRAADQSPVRTSDEAILVPGRHKVWCPRLSAETRGDARAFGGRR